MKYIAATTAICFLSACLGGGGGSSVSTSSSTNPVSTPPASVTVPTPPQPQNFAGMLNNVRASNGAGAVSFDARLGRAAQAHANDMLANNFFSHTGSDGSNVGQRVARQGYQYRTVGENIARGYQTEESVMQGWTNSPGHHANNINPAFEDFGLAKAGSGSNRYWVLVLGAER